jgi:tetratricopeptide (TPR) repeat protein
LNRHQEAIQQYERALAIEPGYAQAHLGLGGALQALGRHEVALGNGSGAGSAKFKHSLAFRRHRG